MSRVMIQVNARVSWAVCLLVFNSPIGNSLAMGMQSATHLRPVQPEARQPLDVLRDEKAEPDAKRAAMRAIQALPESERLDAYRAILLAGASPHAYDAAAGLISAGAPNSVSLIWSVFRTMNSPEQAGLLSRIAEAPNPHEFFLIPRQILEETRARPGALELAQGVAGDNGDVVGASAQILKHSKADRDVALVQAAVRRAPDSMLAWYAIATAEDVPADIANLARKTMHDPVTPQRVRIAAAVVLGRIDTTGNAVVSKTLDEFIAAYSGKTAQDMVQPGQWSSLEYATFQQDLVMLYAALLAPAESVAEVISRAMEGRNEDLKSIALLIASRRWPEEIIARLQSGELAEDEVPAAVAVLTYHPQFKSEIERLIDPTVLADRVRKLQEQGAWRGTYAPSLRIFGILDRRVAEE